MFPLLLVLFIVVPIVEIYAIIQVGQAIGALWTIALLIADSILGSLLMCSQGRAVWRRFNTAIAEARVPAREVLDGGLVIFGGALLLTPGFVTDIFGAAFLLPPSRALIRRLLVRRFAGRMTVAAPPPRRRAAGPRDADVEGTATEVDPNPRTLR
ncbi:MAG: FxsA family protein [Solirubrobacteraceae bacterium]